MHRAGDLIDTTEMYLRCVMELEEDGVIPMRARIAGRLGQSFPTVSQTVSRMQRDGLVTVTGDRRIEAVERRVLDQLGHPGQSPYGNPIPGVGELGARDVTAGAA